MHTKSPKSGKTKYYQMIICFILGCIITALVIWCIQSWSKLTNTRTYLFNAEVVEYTDDVLTVKGLPSNTTYTRGTYLIKVTDDILFTDWKTNKNLDWEVLNKYKYVVVVYTGREKIKDNTYLNGVDNIYCNVEERISNK